MDLVHLDANKILHLKLIILKLIIKVYATLWWKENSKLMTKKISNLFSVVENFLNLMKAFSLNLRKLKL